MAECWDSYRVPYVRLHRSLRRCIYTNTNSHSFFNALYVLMTEIVTAKKSKGEVLVFRRGHKPSQFKDGKGDSESGIPTSSGTSVIATKMSPGNTSDKESALIQKQTSVFHWR